MRGKRRKTKREKKRETGGRGRGEELR